MARAHDEVMAELTPVRRARIEARAVEQLREIEGAQALRKLTEPSQAQTPKNH